MKISFNTIRPIVKNTVQGQKFKSCPVFTSDTFEVSKERGQVYNALGHVYNCNSSYLFRPDLDWSKFPKYLEERFKNYDKVNFLDYACSNGSEAYTSVIMLNDYFGDKAEKFYPVIAKDIDKKLISENIKEQISGEFILNPLGQSIMDKFQKSNGDIAINNYFKVTKIPFSCDKKVKMSDKVLNNVKFSYGNILNDVEKFDEDVPSIVMCRNMWPYVDISEHNRFAKNLYEKLPAGSIVIVGSFDYIQDDLNKTQPNFPNALKKAGFHISRNFPITPFPVIFEKN